MADLFLSPEPVVILEKRFPSAYRNFLATARTCYSSKGIVHDGEIGDKWDFLAKSLYQAGHHTTLQHAYFQFTLDRVSRQFIWSFLHSHPFYNSEQVSQRYVAVKPGNAVIPALPGAALEIYQDTLAAQMAQYRLLGEKLVPLVESEYRKRFPARSLQDKKVRADIQKRAQEAARYVLPVATFAYLYHTVSGVTLLRYYRLCRQFDAPSEQHRVVEKMARCLLEVEPKFQEILEEPLELEATPEWVFFANRPAEAQHARAFIQEFDEGLEGKVSRLIDYKTNNESVLAGAVREVLGLPRSALSDGEAIALVLDPGQNRLLGESLNVTTLSKLSRCLYHPAYTFRKKLSHTADSQDQRHRMTPASRPILAAHLTDEPDFITPELIKLDDAIRREYEEGMVLAWDAMNALRRRGVREEFVEYLLPNAAAVRFTESSDLLNLRHKHAMRLCYNAQEEIWRASLDEARQIAAVNPQIGRYLLPPCTLRRLARQRPLCPEGDRYCGERVWEYELEEYRRII
ncbi:MAG: FAD-dependent thymidylate synthase [bacterium]